MIIYVVLAFVAICLGMFLSVQFFGTGTKRAKAFKEIYFSVEDIEGKGILYTKTGEYSAILKLDNPVQKYSADIDSYYDFTNTMTALMQSLGEGYAIHKQDVFTRKKFGDGVESRPDLLDQSYFRYFKGRPYTDCATYITITQENKKSRFFSYDSKKWRDFLIKVQKAHDMLRDRGLKVRFLTKTSENARNLQNMLLTPLGLPVSGSGNVFEQKFLRSSRCSGAKRSSTIRQKFSSKN